MDMTTIRESSDHGLADRAVEISEEIFRLRCVAERMTPQRGTEIRILRREFARVKMVQNERALVARAKEVDVLLADDSNKAGKLVAWKRRTQRALNAIQAAKGN